MLQPSPIKYEGEVLSIKLIASGQSMIELIAKCVSVDSEVIRVSNPQSLMPMPGKPGEEPQIGMVNFLVTGDSTKVVELNRAHVMAVGLARKEAANAYNNVTSSIIKPNSGVIVK